MRLDSAAVVDFLQLAYAPSFDQAWRDRLLGQTQRLLPTARSGALLEFTTRPVPGGLAVDVGAQTIVGEDTVPGAVLALRDASPALVEQFYARTTANTASGQTGESPALTQPAWWRTIWRRSIQDSLGLLFRDPDGRGILLCVGLTSPMTLSSRERNLLTKLTTHVGAGYRLRRSSGTPSTEAAEAVLTPGGKMLHATTTARDKRDAIDQGRRWRNLSHESKHDAEKALEIWKGLVAGRWSLVDHIDTDGKRFLLAMKNAPAVAAHADLTPRERRVCALVAMGHRDKEISYMLGLSAGAIAASLHRARRKLGVKSRTEMATKWRKLRA